MILFFVCFVILCDTLHSKLCWFAKAHKLHIHTHTHAHAHEQLVDALVCA